MIGTGRILRPLFVCWACLVGLQLRQAQAGPLTATVFDSTNQSWTVSTDDPRVISMTPSPTKGTDQTTSLTIEEAWDAINGLKPLVITFKENAPAAKSVGGGNSSDGLNFLLQKAVTNGTRIAWTSFVATLADMDSQPVPPFDGTHPSYSHFHATKPSAMVVRPKNWGFINPADESKDVTVGGPPLASGLLAFQVPMHDALVQGIQREFVLTEFPVPEPTSLALFGMGGFILVCWRRCAKDGGVPRIRRLAERF